MARLESSEARSATDRARRRGRWIAGALQAAAYLVMLAAVWGAPVRAVLIATRSPEPVWGSPWRVWAMAEWTVAFLVLSYLLWSAADVVRDGLVTPRTS